MIWLQLKHDDQIFILKNTWFLIVHEDFVESSVVDFGSQPGRIGVGLELVELRFQIFEGHFWFDCL